MCWKHAATSSNKVGGMIPPIADLGRLEGVCWTRVYSQALYFSKYVGLESGMKKPVGALRYRGSC